MEKLLGIFFGMAFIISLALGYGFSVLLAWVISLVFHLEINIWLVGFLIYLVWIFLKSIFKSEKKDN